MAIKVLVTGGTGFIGSHLVRSNLQAGNRVRVLVRPDSPSLNSLERVEVAIGDIRDDLAVKKAVEGVNIVFHAAALVTDWAPKRLFREVTVGGMENICQATLDAEVDALVVISSSDVFGTVENVPINESFPMRRWNEPYPDAKIEADEIAWRFHRDRGLPLTVAYPCFAHGPGDRHLLPGLADALLEGRGLYWRKNALITPSSVENIVDLCMTLAVREEALGEGFLVHDGESIYLQDFCRMVADRLGCHPPRRQLPYGAAYLMAKVMELTASVNRQRQRPLLTSYLVKWWGSRSQYSIAKAKERLGWSPPVCLREGLDRTMRWLEAKVRGRRGRVSVG